MQPTSPAQLAAAGSFGVPELEQVRDDVWALGQPMPGEHLPASLLYLLRDGDSAFHVVDPGTDGDENWQRLVEALSTLGGTPADIRTVTVTHLHADHLGMAARIQGATSARVGLHAREVDALHALVASPLTADVIRENAVRWGVPEPRRAELIEAREAAPPVAAPRVDDLLHDGDRLDIPGFDLRVLHTPGHTPGHLTLRDADRGIAFTGDHLLPHLVAGLGLGGPSETNPLADYLESLRRLADVPGDTEVLPGHGYRFRGLAERAREAGDHHLRRTREIEGILADEVGPADPCGPSLSIWELASRLTWTAGWEKLQGFFLWSALAQVEMHRAYLTGDGASPSGD